MTSASAYGRPTGSSEHVVERPDLVGRHCVSADHVLVDALGHVLFIAHWCTISCCDRPTCLGPWCTNRRKATC